jgi:chemotaxis regulatin CheY-phosphate phosphatase CheZ
MAGVVQMTHQEATRLLDMAKDGQPVPEDVLTEAL